LAATLCAPVAVNAQITIGSGLIPDPSAILDLKSQDPTLNVEGVSATQGLLLPRVQLTAAHLAAPMAAHVKGMFVYNTVYSGANADAVSPGLYYNNGTRWVKAAQEGTNWFYMPSIVLDVTDYPSTTKSVPLYTRFEQQFTNVATRSMGAPAVLKSIPAATDIYYYVTGYDSDVFSNINIDANGNLTYTVDPSKVSEATYMNIVFVLK